MICYCALKPEAFSFTEREGRGERGEEKGGD
jgi:hypothetical protein